MKKALIVLFLVLILGGCSYQTYLPHYESSLNIDFREYSKKDFLFSSSNYSGKYESVGITSIGFFPEVKLKGRGEKGENYDQVKFGLFENFLVENINLKYITNKMHKEATDKGANAIINIEVTRMQNPYYQPDPKNYYDGMLSAISYGWIITGMAIKRLD